MTYQQHKNIQYSIEDQSKTIRVRGSVDDLVKVAEEIEKDVNPREEPEFGIVMAEEIHHMKRYEQEEIDMYELIRLLNSPLFFTGHHRIKLHVDFGDQGQEGALYFNYFSNYDPPYTAKEPIAEYRQIRETFLRVLEKI